MILKAESKDVSSGSRRRIIWLFVLAICILCICSMIFLFAGKGNENNKKVDSVPTEGVPSVVAEKMTPTPTVRVYSEAERQGYLSFVTNYNQIVDEYNSQILRYNNLLDMLGFLDFLELPNSYLKEEHLQEDFDESLYAIQMELEKHMQDLKESGNQADEDYVALCVSAYNCAIDEYNMLVERCRLLETTGVFDFISDYAEQIEPKEHILGLTEEMEKGVVFVKYEVEEQFSENEELAEKCFMMQQIICPSEDWIIDRLHKVDEIAGIQAVMADNDPNQLLGKEGGYICCVYFSDKFINQASVRGDTIVDKGTDCGGAIEVYENREYALNRCEYLSQFDGTLLYSGSYAVVGTIVIRTSYKLNSKGQVDLTDAITRVFTSVGDS